jgi:hypothetical protein
MKWYQWVFSGIGITTITVLIILIRKLLSQPSFIGIRILDRNQVDRALGTVQERLRKANQDVWMSGNDCKFVAESLSGEITATLNRGIRIKILCVDPESSAIQMLARIDPRFPTPESFVNSMKSVENVLKDLSKQYPNLFEYRFLPILPALGFFITDPTDKKGIVKVEIYTTKEWKPIKSRPHFILSSISDQWRQYFISQWENYWGLARKPAALPTEENLRSGRV